MLPRSQQTPHGEIRITSGWVRDRYYLVASGSDVGLRWLFPDSTRRPERNGNRYRVIFPPAPHAITVERELRKIASQWQAAWDEHYVDFQETGQAEYHVDAGPQIETLGQLFDHLYQQRLSTVAKSTSSRDKYRLKIWREELGNDRNLGSINGDVIKRAQLKLNKGINLKPCTRRLENLSELGG